MQRWKHAAGRRSHARTSVRTASKAATQDLANFTAVRNMVRPILQLGHFVRSNAVSTAYLPSFQISAASFQSLPTFSHTTTYLPATSCGVGALVFKLKVPISRAAEGPNRLTSRVVNFGSLTCSAMFFHIAAIAARPFTMPEPGGNALASAV